METITSYQHISTVQEMNSKAIITAKMGANTTDDRVDKSTYVLSPVVPYKVFEVTECRV